VGAASAFLLDPQHGARRRSLVRDKVNQTMNDGREFADAAREDLRSRAQGIAAQARSWRGGTAPDEMLERGSDAIRDGFGLLQENWTPGVRVAAGGVGALLLLYALARGGLTGIGALAAGAALLGRAGANRPLTALVPQRETESA
jgi:hypothetical protein